MRWRFRLYAARFAAGRIVSSNSPIGVNPSNDHVFDETAPYAAYMQYGATKKAAEEHVRAAQALRFAVFNVELDEGLAASFSTGLDADRFDAVCDHLLVCVEAEEARGGAICRIASSGMLRTWTFSGPTSWLNDAAFFAHISSMLAFMATAAPARTISCSAGLPRFASHRSNSIAISPTASAARRFTHSSK